MPSTSPNKHVSGFVSIAGRPNAGKSTLLNALLGTKLAIVANKPQTTRNAIQGVLTLPQAQIVFVDMPGIHKPDSAFNQKMMETVSEALAERDLVLFLVDATSDFTPEDEEAAKLVADVGTPVLLVTNKMDLLKNNQALLPLITRYRELLPLEEALPISATRGDGLDTLRQAILSRLPEGPAYFPEDYLTDQPERFLASEIIREKILQVTRHEVPHAVAVVVESWEEKHTLTKITATIYVERDGQKGILIGKGGALLKRIGTEARQEIEGMLDRKVFLDLTVRVRLKWRENPQFLKEIDWKTMIGE